MIVLNQILPDHGPIYTETILDRFPVEPWNTVSNLIFLLAFIYFTNRIRKNWRHYPLLTVCLPLLLIGFIGGTVFHATRSHRIWLIMDYLPISLICLIAAFYFWRQLTSSRLFASLGILLPFITLQIIWRISSMTIVPRIALTYSLLAIALILPSCLCSRLEKWKGLNLICYAVICFIIAITCRTIDREVGAVLPMGSHFLWHIFGGLSSIFMLKFAEGYEANKQKRL